MTYWAIYTPFISGLWTIFSHAGILSYSTECQLPYNYSFPVDILLDVGQTLFLLTEDTVNDSIPGELEFCLSTAQRLQREATVRVVTTQEGTAESKMYCYD